MFEEVVEGRILGMGRDVIILMSLFCRDGFCFL